jgi:hypothetical protein
MSIAENAGHASWLRVGDWRMYCNSSALQRVMVEMTQGHALSNRGTKMTTTPKHDARVAKMSFASVYPLYVAKVEKKGRTEEELRQVIEWLTGFGPDDLAGYMENNANFERFFAEATLNPNAELITGMICGYRIEEIETVLTRQVRYLDKLVDELARGRKMEKILRS